MESRMYQIENSLLLKDSLWIYSDGMSAEYEDIESLLKQPREKVIHDMEVLINDALENPSFYKKVFSNPSCNLMIEDDFVITSLLILGDLKAEESLPLLFKAFSMDQEWIDLLIYSEYREMIWDAIINLGKNHLDKIFDFLMDPGTSTWSRAVFSDALEQLALNYPDYRQPVIELKERIIKHYTSGKVSITEDIIDHVGMTVWSLINLGSIESLPLFKKVFDLEMIEKDLFGDYKMAEEATFELNKNNSEGLKREIMNFADRYSWYWEMIQEEVDAMRLDDDDLYPEDDFNYDLDDFWGEEDEDFDKNSDEIDKPDPEDYKDTKYDHLKVSKSELPRRNDPCPCGSGEKYKNCCMLNDLNPGSLN